MKKYFFIDNLDQVYYSFFLFKETETPKFFTFSDSPTQFLESVGFDVKQNPDYFSDINGKINDSEIYFFSRCWNMELFSMIKHLSKNNTVFLYLRKQYAPEKSKSTKSTFMKLFFLFFDGIETDIIKEGNLDVPMLSDKFLSKHNIKINYIDFSLPHIKIKNEFSEKIEGKDVLLVLSYLPQYSLLSEEEFLSFNKYLIEILGDKKYFVKQHPKDKKEISCYEKDSIIEKFIPSEFLFDFDWKFVIGIESYSLVFAKNHTNAKVISCLEMLNLPKETKETYHRFLESESAGITYPKTKEELESLLNES